MSLSDCPKCWTTPCECGYEYARMSQDQRERIFVALSSVRDGNYKPTPIESPYPPPGTPAPDIQVTPEQEATARALMSLRKRKLHADAAGERIQEAKPEVLAAALRAVRNVETYLYHAGDNELAYGHVRTMLQQEGFALNVAVGENEPPPEASEEHRQMLVLAIAELSLRRPGFEPALREVAKTLQAEAMFNGFRTTSHEQPRP